MLYSLHNLLFQSDFIKDIKEFFKDKKKLIIFDVGCYKGVFTKKILNTFNGNIKHIYLFDINKKVKKYIYFLRRKKYISYHEIALSHSTGSSIYNYNKFFESAGSSLSNLVKNDKKWNFSRRVITGDFNKRDNGFSNYNVKTSTLDTFVRKKKIKYIDICKVDIEGSELDFLKGSKKTLKQNKIKILAIEVLDNKKKFIKKEKQIIALLKKNNFKLIKKKDIRSVSFLSNLKGRDYLFLNYKYKNN